MNAIHQFCQNVHSQISRVVVGQKENLNLLLVALLSDGHILFEGVPGTGKTLLANTFSKVLNLSFNRIQFTPDLMPGDIIGTNLFNFHTNTFSLTKGPIFTQFCLADEINRTPPKTQAALLQAMQERVVTIDGTSYLLDAHFMVIATQNPLENEGTYPLPEAQLDRFLFKLYVGYPSRDQERNMVRLHGQHASMPKLEDFNLQICAEPHQLSELKAEVKRVRLKDEIADYIVDIVRATREHSSLLAGASPRSINMLATAARAYAAILDRDFVIPDDVKMLITPTLEHRVILGPTAELEGIQVRDVLQEVVQSITVPR